MSMAMKYRLFASALACTLLVYAVAAHARKPPHPAPPPASTQPNPMNLEQAVKQVQHQTGGHILAADTVSRGKSNVYRIKVLTPKGQVRVVQMHSNVRAKPGKGRSDSEGGH
jgi:hypothetical protein